MKKLSAITVFSVGFSCFASGAYAASADDPLLFMLKADKFEVRDADEGTVTAWEGHVWAGKDINKLWIKSEGERLDGDTEKAEVQLLYSRAIDPNWDLQAGWRHDVEPSPQRDWFAIGFYGIAPYFIEIDSALFIKEGDEVNLRVEAEYEFMLTQKWVLSPEVEVNWFSDDDEDVGIGSGFARLEAGLRLRYEITRQFAPYIGINYEQLLEDTKDIAEAEDEETSDTQLVAGLRFWF